MSKRSGWYEDPDRTYYADEHGRPIVVKAKGYQYNSPEMNIPTYPTVVRGDYKPSSDAPSSYPPRSQPSAAASRFSDRNTPYFGPGSEHSGRGHVDHPASKPSVSGVSRPGISTDVYRDAKAQFSAAGPSTSAYDQQYYAYKAQGDVDVATGRRYETWKKDTYVQPTNEDKRNHPEAWGGRPLQTREWHQEGSQRAGEAVRQAQAHADAREEYKADYIGYHQQHYHSGHQKAVDMARDRATYFRGEVRNHDNWDSLKDRQEAGRQRRGERAQKRG
ncbi:hypothetical protein F5Y13DRAFT_194695 [Hypoxylon sp. FL1857]|nr:hypothetical protein F5Y13DRAFT_194695 [Hypoxylon sp. FL1857]